MNSRYRMYTYSILILYVSVILDLLDNVDPDQMLQLQGLILNISKLTPESNNLSTLLYRHISPSV